VSSAGYELPLLLFAGFRSVIDELHAELARQGHPDARPAHGFAMQAIGSAYPSRRRARQRDAWKQSATRAAKATTPTTAVS
jgi:hypothetical protein